MKRLTLHWLIASLTFVAGASVAGFACLRPSSPRAPGQPVTAQNLKPSDADASAWRVLLSFENQNLRDADGKSRAELRKAVDTLVGRRDREPLIPRLVSRISNGRGQINYAIVEESPLISIPGDSGLRIHLFNLEGKLLSSSAFSAGWRIRLTGIEIRYLPEIGREALEVSSQPDINGRDVAKQYYAVVGEKVLLVRLEDGGGNLIRNTYGAPNQTIGLTLTGRSADEWEKALESDDAAEVLATLTWLSGAHWNPQNPPPDYLHEEIGEARLADHVRSREGVKAMLKKLARSDNAWVQSAARLAVKVEYYPGGVRLG